MKLLEQDKKDFVRIIIGSASSGKSGIKAPTKTMSVEGISVEQMWEKIYDMIEKENKKNEKQSKN